MKFSRHFWFGVLTLSSWWTPTAARVTNPKFYQIITGTVLLLYLWLFLTPLLIYYTWKYYRLRKLQAIKKRHPTLVIVFNILCGVYIAFDKPTAISMHSFGVSEKQQLFLVIFGRTAYALTIHGMCVIFLARYYFLFYNIHSSKASSQGTLSTFPSPFPFPFPFPFPLYSTSDNGPLSLFHTVFPRRMEAILKRESRNREFFSFP